MSESAQQQVTDIYNQLASINGVLSKLASLSAVSTIQQSLQLQLNTIYANIQTLQTAINAMDTTVSGLLVQVRDL